MDSSGPGQGSVAGSCEHVNENCSSIKGRKFLDRLNDYYFLKKDSAVWN
jgi:hypothetical protein